MPSIDFRFVLFQFIVLIGVAVPLVGCSSTPQPWTSIKGSIERDKETVAESHDEDGYVVDRYPCSFDPINTDNLTTIYIFIDTEGLWWWPNECGAWAHWDICPDYIQIFDESHQVWGIKKLGRRHVTTFGKDGQPDHGELFIYRKEENPKRFEMAREALERGGFVFRIATHLDDRPYELRVGIGFN